MLSRLAALRRLGGIERAAMSRILAQPAVQLSPLRIEARGLSTHTSIRLIRQHPSHRFLRTLARTRMLCSTRLFEAMSYDLQAWNAPVAKT